MSRPEISTEGLARRIDEILVDEVTRTDYLNISHRWIERRTPSGDSIIIAYSERQSQGRESTVDRMHALLHRFIDSDGDIMYAQYNLTEQRVGYSKIHPGNEHLSVTQAGEARGERPLRPNLDLGRISLLIDCFESDDAVKVRVD